MTDLWQIAVSRGLPCTGFLLTVETTHQNLQVIQQNKQLCTYPISTSCNGLGCEQDSQKTPTGWHEVVDKIGAEHAAGQVFVSRKPVNRVILATDWKISANEDLILSRILRLRGLEPGHNVGPGVDSYNRFIYIHGTNQEHLLGQPASMGCIRMANHDVIELFDHIRETKAYCWIGERQSLTITTKSSP